MTDRDLHTELLRQLEELTEAVHILGPDANLPDGRIRLNTRGAINALMRANEMMNTACERLADLEA